LSPNTYTYNKPFFPIGMDNINRTKFAEEQSSKVAAMLDLDKKENKKNQSLSKSITVKIKKQ
ncbi:MAG: hypothetical protein KIT56_03275, partial [Gammaproteobacteria bacterium]|nr:hypothetical protein [Gammaproteobacteria bacterium]